MFVRPELVGEPKKKLNVYNKPSMLLSIKNVLQSKGGSVLEKFENGCFGHCLSWTDLGAFHNGGIYELFTLQHQSLDPNELHFYVGGKSVRLAAPEFSLITGLSFGHSSFDPSKNYVLKCIGVAVRVCEGNNISADDLDKKFSGNLIEDEDDIIRVANILVLWYFVLGYQGKKILENWIWALVDDLDAWNRFPWGSYSYGALHHYINSLGHTSKQIGSSLNVQAPAWVLQVNYLSCI